MHKNNIRHLFIGVLWLLLTCVRYAGAQNNGVTVDDLPSCAIPCADLAAEAVNCDTQDNACLCSEPSFATSTLKCANKNCRPDVVVLSRQVLSEMCASVTSSTTSSTTTSSSSTTTTSTTSSSTTATTSLITATSTSVTVVPPSTTSSQSTSQSASSTVVVVQTIVLPQPSTTLNTFNAAGRLNTGSIFFMGTLSIFVFALPPLISLIAAI